MDQLLLLGVFICMLAILLTLIYGFHKVRRFQRFILNSFPGQMESSFTLALDKQFRQSEALAGIFIELGFKKSLPPTRGWAASPDLLREIALHTLHAHPKAIAECGSGVSTIILARCMQMQECGHVYSLDHSQEYAERTRQELERHGLREWATVLNAPLRFYDLNGEAWPWYAIEELPTIGFDMLVIDGPPEEVSRLARYPAGPLLFGRLNAGAVVFLDDANRHQEKKILQCWAKEFPNFRQELRECEKGCAILLKDGKKMLVDIDSVAEDRVQLMTDVDRSRVQQDSE